MSRVLCAVLGVAVLAALAPAGASAGAGEDVAGRVMSARQGLGGWTVTLYRARAGADRPAARVGSARTIRTGEFALPFSGPATSRDVFYVVAGRSRRGGRGGGGRRKPATVGGVAGGRQSLAAVLGVSPFPRSIVINERTTVAAGYALAQFIRPGGGVTGNAPGLQNAAGMAGNLADPRTGDLSAVLRRTPNGGQTETLRKFNTLANILVDCIRSAVRCAPLYRLATPPRGPAPRTMHEAVASIARNPWQNVRGLFALARTGARPYRPALASSRRVDAWTLAIRFLGDGRSIDGPGNFAIDAGGNVWATNNYTFSRDVRRPACGSDLVVRLTPTGRNYPGAPYRGGGLSGAGYGITFDPDGNVWLGNYGFAAPTCPDQPPHNSVSKFSGAGDVLSPATGFTQGNISWPQGTVSDRQGNLWIANCGNDSVTVFPGGDPNRARNITNLGLTKPFDIAVTAEGTVFVTAVESSTMALLSPDGTPLPNSPVTGGGLRRPMGIAADSKGNMWVANSGLVDLPCPSLTAGNGVGGSVSLFTPEGVPAQDTGFTGGGLTVPWGIAVDGNDTVWVSNFAGKRVSNFCGTRVSACPPGKRTGDPISPDGTGYGFDGFTRNTSVQVDPSGNLWVANNWKQIPIQTNPGGYEIVVMPGIAAPIRTPLIGPPTAP